MVVAQHSSSFFSLEEIFSSSFSDLFCFFSSLHTLYYQKFLNYWSKSSWRVHRLDCNFITLDFKSEICFLTAAIFLFCSFLLIFCFLDMMRLFLIMQSKSSKTCEIKLHVEKIKYVKSEMDINVMLR